MLIRFVGVPNIAPPLYSKSCHLLFEQVEKAMLLLVPCGQLEMKVPSLRRSEEERVDEKK